MKIRVLFILFCLSNHVIHAQQEYDYTILLSGASFASPSNTWFETACERLNAFPINPSGGGESIVTTATLMYEERLYTKEQLDDIDVLVLMQVHDRDVFNNTGNTLKEKYTDYSFPFNGNDYVGAFDYVIKRYYADCYQLRFDPKSKYYNSLAGKPVIIVMCTHWHDARKVYNATIRQLCEKWKLPLIEFDANIGFSSDTVHPVTGKQISVHYAVDTQEINGVTYGWHPIRGKDSYIQQRMASIFVSKMKQILLVPGTIVK